MGLSVPSGNSDNTKSLLGNRGETFSLEQLGIVSSIAG